MAYSPQIQGLDKTGGSAGAVGVTGPTGPTGITGPTGPTGSGGGSSIWTYTSGTMAAGKMKTSNAVVSSTVTISLSVQAKVAGPAWNNFFENYVTFGISFLLLLVDSAGKTFVFGVSSVTNTGSAGTENYALGLTSLLVDGTSWSGDYSIFFVPKPATAFDPASPGPIGGTTPAAASFTTLGLTGMITGPASGNFGIQCASGSDQVVVNQAHTIEFIGDGNSMIVMRGNQFYIDVTYQLRCNGGLLYRAGVSARSTTPITLTTADSGVVNTNEGATALNVQNLPTAVAGLIWEGIVQDADGIQVVAAAGDTIRIAGSVSATAGNAQSTTIGSTLTLKAINSTEWYATSTNGSWTVT